MLTLCSLSFWTQSRTTTYDIVLLTCRVHLSIATNPTQKLLHTYDRTFISQMFQESVMLTVNLSYHKFTLYQCNTLQGLGQPISLVLPLIYIQPFSALISPMPTCFLCGHPMVLETLLSQHVFLSFFFFNTAFLYIALHSGISGQLYSDSIPGTYCLVLEAFGNLWYKHPQALYSCLFHACKPSSIDSLVSSLDSHDSNCTRLWY